MKRVILHVFGIALIVMGLAGFGVEIENMVKGNQQDIVFGLALAVCFLVMGILMVRAGRRNYRLSWSLVFGFLLAFFGVGMTTMVVDEMLAGRMDDVTIGFVLGAVFAGSGIALLKRGRRHHIKSVISDTTSEDVTGTLDRVSRHSHRVEPGEAEEVGLGSAVGPRNGPSW